MYNLTEENLKMDAIHLDAVIQKDGEIKMKGLPYKKGERVEMILVVHSATRSKRQKLTARKLRMSGLIGLWKDRSDIGDSVAFARQLRG
jgi:hypothetical protein